MGRSWGISLGEGGEIELPQEEAPMMRVGPLTRPCYLGGCYWLCYRYSLWEYYIFIYYSIALIELCYKHSCARSIAKCLRAFNPKPAVAVV